MFNRIIKGCVGLLLFATAFAVWPQGGGAPLSPAQASTIVARKASDKQLESEVLAAIANARVDASKVKVRVYNGVVTLRGVVPTADQAKAASSAAATVQRVTTVKNRLSYPADAR